MVAEGRTAPLKQTRALGSWRCVQSHVVWPVIPSYDGALPRSWHLIGHLSRSPSQWPGTARSSISAGRSRMEIASMICPDSRLGVVPPFR